MLYLKKPSAADLKEYFNKLKDNIIHVRDTIGLSNEARDFLTEDRIEHILTDEPDKLLAHHDDFMPLIYPQFDVLEYQQVFVAKKNFNKTDEEKALIQRYTDALAPVFAIIDYEKFLSSKKPRAYNLALKLKRNTCTYCNRLYTNTVIHRESGKKTTNNDDRITRPQFDHWFAHSRYPLLGLSFYNLIPSCSVCNSSVKGDESFQLDSHIHPYIKEADQHFKFSFILKDTHEANVKVIATGDKMIKHLKAFKIMEIYGAHSDLELKDLLDLKYKYSENYLNTLFDESFRALNIQKKDVYRLIFGVEYDEENFHRRTFSKFKRDILNELDIIA